MIFFSFDMGKWFSKYPKQNKYETDEPVEGERNESPTVPPRELSDEVQRFPSNDDEVEQIEKANVKGEKSVSLKKNSPKKLQTVEGIYFKCVVLHC